MKKSIFAVLALVLVCSINVHGEYDSYDAETEEITKGIYTLEEEWYEIPYDEELLWSEAQTQILNDPHREALSESRLPQTSYVEIENSDKTIVSPLASTTIGFVVDVSEESMLICDKDVMAKVYGIRKFDECELGDYVVVFHDGGVKESYPLGFSTIYACEKLENIAASFEKVESVREDLIEDGTIGEVE